ncbi:hypothetical protein BK645_09010 [Pseudomonas protegens]|jgi:hypothetical protein|nr:hypothetical protein BK645_09010 [Pseudomonas protegens]ROM36733.1 hypothetical protein BK646_17050 [Pseudomonas protegens]
MKIVAYPNVERAFARDFGCCTRLLTGIQIVVYCLFEGRFEFSHGLPLIANQGPYELKFAKEAIVLGTDLDRAVIALVLQ